MTAAAAESCVHVSQREQMERENITKTCVYEVFTRNDYSFSIKYTWKPSRRLRVMTLLFWSQTSSPGDATELRTCAVRKRVEAYWLGVLAVTICLLFVFPATSRLRDAKREHRITIEGDGWKIMELCCNFLYLKAVFGVDHTNRHGIDGSTGGCCAEVRYHVPRVWVE